MLLYNRAMADIEKISKMIVQFRDERDWKQFHNPKDLAIALVEESVELLEHFKWKSPEEMKEYVVSHKREVGDELADVLYWVLLFSHDLGIDIVEAIERKMEENRKKYSVEKAKGRHNKYTDYQ